MSIISRFLGKKDASDDQQLVANEQEGEIGLSLTVLFEQKLNIKPEELRRKLCDYHPSLSKVKLDIDEQSNDLDIPLGLVGWDNHVIRLIGFNAPVPEFVLENCVDKAHYDSEIKTQAKSHQSHLILSYQGYETDPLQQYVAMALFAGFLSDYGAVVVVNEVARTSFPTKVLNANTFDEDIIEMLETLPLPMLYCGFVKYHIEGVEGIWLRTYGAYLLGLPDMASLVENHENSQEIFDIITNVFHYLRTSGAKFHDQDTMQVGDDFFMKLRLPTTEEYFLESEQELFVAEFITSAEINQH